MPCKSMLQTVPVCLAGADKKDWQAQGRTSSIKPFALTNASVLSDERMACAPTPCDDLHCEESATIPKQPLEFPPTTSDWLQPTALEL